MKKIGQLMEEMGFRKDAPDSVKEAFLKHLIKSATGAQVATPSEKSQKLQSKVEPQQMSLFDTDDPDKKVS